MATPEHIETPPVSQGVQQTPEGFSPEVEKQFHEFKIQPTPTAPQQVQDDQGNVIAQPTQTVDPNQPTQTVPQPLEVIAAWKKEPATSSKKWLGVFWDRVIKVANNLGKRIVVGGKEK